MGSRGHNFDDTLDAAPVADVAVVVAVELVGALRVILPIHGLLISSGCGPPS